MDIELVKKKLEGMHDWQEFYLHEVGEMLECAMEHIAKLEAAQQPLAPDGETHLCGGKYYTDKVLGKVCCRCQAPRR